MASNTRAIKAGSAFIEFTLKDSKLRKGLAKLERDFRKFGRTIQRTGRALLGIGTGLAALSAYPIKLAADLETTTAAFTAMTQSAELSAQMIRELEEFSKISIVDINSLQKSAMALLGYGVAAEEVVGNVKALTAVARGSGERLDRLALAFGQVAAKGRLMAQEVRQFVEAGLNPLQVMAEASGKSMGEMDKMLADGAISAADVARALDLATSGSGRFANMLEEMSKTLAGKWARAMATFKLAIRPVGEAILPKLHDILDKVLAKMDDFAAFLRKYAEQIAMVATAAVAMVAAGAALIGIGAAFSFLASALAVISGVIGAIGVAVAALVSPLGLLVASLVGIATWFATATEAGQKMVRSFTDAFSRMSKVVKESFGLVMELVSVQEFEQAMKVITQTMIVLWEDAAHMVKQAWVDVSESVLKTMKDMMVKMSRVVITASVTMTHAVQTRWENVAAHTRVTWAEIVMEVRKNAEMFHAETAALWSPETLGDLPKKLRTIEFTYGELAKVLSNERNQIGKDDTPVTEKFRAAGIDLMVGGIDATLAAMIGNIEQANKEGLAAAEGELEAARAKLEAVREEARFRGEMARWWQNFMQEFKDEKPEEVIEKNVPDAVRTPGPTRGLFNVREFQALFQGPGNAQERTADAVEEQLEAQYSFYNWMKENGGIVTTQ